MDFGLPPIGRTDQASPSREARPPEPAGSDFRASLAREVQGPPPSALVDVAAASRRYEELRAMKRELHFKTDAASGRIVVEVRDLDGNLIRTVPPSEALEIVAGTAQP